MLLHKMVSLILTLFFSSILRQFEYFLGKADVMAVLVEVAGVNINATDVGGNTPLHDAVSRGISNKLCNIHIKYFGHRNNNVPEPNAYCLTMWAANVLNLNAGNSEVAVILMSVPNINLNVKNRSGKTAEQLAR